MSPPQFNVRIPSSLDKQVKLFAKANNVSKNKVMIDALNHYLGCMEKISLNQQLAEIKEKIKNFSYQICG
ncbi:MAG: toxin-antitoxin system HicB family antitoxin [Richelia sp. RM2_1_2]|nr:toxin-antitoxin system HicB family antitoxin [Richelia sp. RM2_1_2]